MKRLQSIRRTIVAGALTLACLPSCVAADLALLRNGFTIRHERHQVLGENTRLFMGSSDSGYVDVPTSDIEGFEKDLSLPPHLAKSVSPANSVDLNQVVKSASANYHLDPDLVNSVIRAESGFNTRAVSRKGAQGLMQLMPGTAEKLGVTNPLDPAANVDGGARYLRTLLERYNYDLVKALAAYNAGPMRVEQYRGVPPYRETRAYVNGIVRDYNRKKIAQEKAAKRAGRPAGAKAHDQAGSLSQR
ncbi:MAG: lytic transglycosylase domain-containing protein [Acidobacteria bacterium]|nr:lytic transglycosylase domain-containing protein [Acidobacteriota bacterium]